MNIVKKIISILILIYLGLGLFLYLFQNSFIYHPGRKSLDYCPGFENLERIDQNGTRILYKRAGEKFVIVYHGNAGSICDRLYLKEILDKEEVSYAFVEYYGYAAQKGYPNKKQILKNVKDTHEYFFENILYKELIVIGESIGAAAASYHSYIGDVDKLFLISPPKDLSSVAKYHFPIYPIDFFLKEDYQITHWLKNFEGQLGIIHGNIDTTIPMSISWELFKSLDNKNKEFTEINGAGHNDLFEYQEAMKALADFI